MSAKVAPLDLLEIKILRNKGYDTIIYVHDVTNKTLSCGSNYILNMVL